MLKQTAAASLLIAILSCPLAQAQQNSSPDPSGFGGPSLPSQPTNTQSEQVDIPGDQPMAASGATQRTGTQASGNRLNLPPVTTGMPMNGSFTARGSLALSGTGQTELPPARYGILSEGDGLAPGIGSSLSTKANTSRAVNTGSPDGALPPARYAVLSEKSGVGDQLTNLQQLGKSLPARVSATEGF